MVAQVTTSACSERGRVAGEITALLLRKPGADINCVNAAMRLYGLVADRPGLGAARVYIDEGGVKLLWVIKSMYIHARFDPGGALALSHRKHKYMSHCLLCEHPQDIERAAQLLSELADEALQQSA